MEDIENQQNQDYRSQLVDRMRSRYPDRNFDGGDGGNGGNDYDRSILDTFNEYDENNKRLVDLFRTDSKAAAFFNAWVKTGNPAEAFRNLYGHEAFEAMSSPEGAEILARIQADEAKNKADYEAESERISQNYQKSQSILNEWASGRGLSDEDKMDILERCFTLQDEMDEGIFSKELFDAVWKSLHYDSDVQAARQEGEVTGRNAKIEERARQRREQSMMSPALSGQGSRVRENPTEERETWGSLLRKR